MNNMNSKRQESRFGMILSLIVSLVLSSSMALAAGKTTQRPLSDFLSTQGTYCTDDGNGGCFVYVPPDKNFLGWTTVFDPNKLPVVPSRPQPPLFAGVDYAGLATEAYAPGKAPNISGTVTERVLKDGRAEVTVLLHTKNANAWVIELDPAGDVAGQVANKPTLFGHRPRDVAAGDGQALGNSLLHVVFIIDKPGAPLPDLLKINGTPDLTFLAFTMSASGPLTAQYDDVVEGTPGKCTIVQTGLVGNGKGRALSDAFPVEDINLSVVGK
jgi:hypothetical protein